MVGSGVMDQWKGTAEALQEKEEENTALRLRLELQQEDCTEQKALAKVCLSRSGGHVTPRRVGGLWRRRRRRRRTSLETVSHPAIGGL